MGKRFSPKKYNIICGVYAITNKINGKKYIGKSENIYVRWDEHRKELNKNIHNNKHLQRAWNKYKENNFSFQIIEICDSNEAAYQREIYWIKYYDSFKNGYNMNEGGTGGLGYKHTQEDIEKMSIIQKEHANNPGYREMLSDAHNDYKKPIVQIDLINNTVNYWDSKNKAGRHLNLQAANILSALNRDNHFAHDSLWFYQEDYNENINIWDYIAQTDMYYRYIKYYQYNFKGSLIKIWDYDELCNSKYINDCVYKCCNFQKGFYENSIWLFEKDINQLSELVEKYKNKAKIYCEPINVFDLNGVYLRTSENIYTESILSDCRAYDICLCCEGKRKSVKSLIFKYINIL